MATKPFTLKSQAWYHRPPEGQLSKEQFEHLKKNLMIEFRFWLRSTKKTVFWSKRYGAVGVVMQHSWPEYERIKNLISTFIHGYFAALEQTDGNNTRTGR